MGKFILCDNGFQMKFENGLTASIQLEHPGYDEDDPYYRGVVSEKTYVAAIEGDDNFVTPNFIPKDMNEFDATQSNMSTSDVVDFLVKVRDYNNEN